MRYLKRSFLIAVVILVLICGWFSTWQQLCRDRELFARDRVKHEQQARFLQKELERARDQLRDLVHDNQSDPTRAFWEAKLDGLTLQDMKLVSNGNAFQKATFRKCNLVNATLTGGVASFQFACFDAANLEHANLLGGHASFQASTFVGAELSGATLMGDASSFQGASFEDANLTGAKIAGNFQNVNLNGAKLQSADVSAINGSDLASCYFDRPPTYNENTKFPVGFDPRDYQWLPAE